jgi:prevent-host-death family protein
MSRRMTVSEARDVFAETVNRVAYSKERIVVERRGRKLVAVVPMEDLETLERLDDEADVRAAKKALKSGKYKTLEQVKKELGI